MRTCDLYGACFLRLPCFVAPRARFCRRMTARIIICEQENEWSSGICDCFSDCRNCIVAFIPGVNFFSLGQSFVVMEGKESIDQEPVCGIMLPGAASVGMCVEYAFAAWYEHVENAHRVFFTRAQRRDAWWEQIHDKTTTHHQTGLLATLERVCTFLLHALS